MGVRSGGGWRRGAVWTSSTKALRLFRRAVAGSSEAGFSVIELLLGLTLSLCLALGLAPVWVSFQAVAATEGDRTVWLAQARVATARLEKDLRVAGFETCPFSNSSNRSAGRSFAGGDPDAAGRRVRVAGARRVGTGRRLAHEARGSLSGCSPGGVSPLPVQRQQDDAGECRYNQIVILVPRSGTGGRPARVCRAGVHRRGGGAAHRQGGSGAQRTLGEGCGAGGAMRRLLPAARRGAGQRGAIMLLVLFVAVAIAVLAQALSVAVIAAERGKDAESTGRDLLADEGRRSS